MEQLSERAVQFGRENSLVGIIAQATAQASSELPTIVILNSGIIHRVGHHRMYVTMSRRLAEAGYAVLRFDFAGLGDSTPRSEGLAPLESSLSDIGDALDWLQSTRQVSRVILMGLCYGADYALLYGHKDPRVVGLVLMDPSIPPTTRYLIHYFGRRLTRMTKLDTWLNLSRGRSRIWSQMTERLLNMLRPTREPQDLSLQNPKTPFDLEQIYQHSVDRGVEFLAIFTAGAATPLVTYREQLLDGFPNLKFGKQLRLEFFKNSDHVFTSQSDRERLNFVILEWIMTTDFAAKSTSLERVS